MTSIQIMMCGQNDFNDMIALFQNNGYGIGSLNHWHLFLIVDREYKFVTSRPGHVAGMPCLTLTEEVLCALELLPSFESKEEFIFSNESISL